MEDSRAALAQAQQIIARAQAALGVTDHVATHYPQIYRAVALGEATKAVWRAAAALQALQHAEDGV